MNNYEQAPAIKNYDQRLNEAANAIFFDKKFVENDGGVFVASQSWPCAPYDYKAISTLDPSGRRTEISLVRSTKADNGDVISRVYWCVNYASERRSWLQMAEKTVAAQQVTSVKMTKQLFIEWTDSLPAEFEAGTLLADSQTHEAFIADLETYVPQTSMHLVQP